MPFGGPTPNDPVHGLVVMATDDVAVNREAAANHLVGGDSVAMDVDHNPAVGCQGGQVIVECCGSPFAVTVELIDPQIR